MEKLFKSLCVCSECKSKMTYFVENKKQKLICGKYRRGEGCSRNVVPETFIFEIVEDYCKRKNIEIEMTNDFMKSLIKEIILYPNKFYEIFYHNGDKNSWN